MDPTSGYVFSLKLHRISPYAVESVANIYEGCKLGGPGTQLIW